MKHRTIVLDSTSKKVQSSLLSIEKKTKSQDIFRIRNNLPPKGKSKKCLTGFSFNLKSVNPL